MIQEPLDKPPLGNLHHYHIDRPDDDLDDDTVYGRDWTSPTLDAIAVSVLIGFCLLIGYVAMTAI